MPGIVKAPVGGAGIGGRGAVAGTDGRPVVGVAKGFWVCRGV